MILRGLIFFLVLTLAACATPGAPTGGPVDSTPPVLIDTVPADGVTNVADGTVTLTFSERLDGASATAVTVTPSGAEPPEVTVSAREVRVRIPTLRDSTTYVITLGTALRDARGVALRAPITVAFSTGDVIDRARVRGVVRDPETGDGVQANVWAYALADSSATPALDAPPDYQTETAADGSFELSYLRRAPYAVVAVQDRNRNGRIDPAERVAVPPQRVVRADTAQASPLTWWATVVDTIPPRPQRVRALSDQRLTVRFDEAVRLLNADTGAWTVADSASGRSVDAQVYQPADSPLDVFLVADAPLSPTPHRVSYRPGATPSVADSSGANAAAFSLSFVPPTRPDTVVARVAAFLPASRDSALTLAARQRPGVRFSAPPDTARLRLVVGDEVRDVRFETADGVTYRPVGDLPPRFEIVAATADSTVRRAYAVATERETGGIVGRVEGGGTVEIQSATGDRITVVADDAFSVGGLLPGDYTVRVWRDLNGDGRWTGGALSPYRAPEPLRLLAEPVEVRARWETDLETITLP